MGTFLTYIADEAASYKDGKPIMINPDELDRENSFGESGGQGLLSSIIDTALYAYQTTLQITKWQKVRSKAAQLYFVRVHLPC